MGPSVVTVGHPTSGTGERSSASAAGVVPRPSGTSLGPAAVAPQEAQVSLAARTRSQPRPAFASVLATIQGERSHARNGPCRDAAGGDDAGRSGSEGRPWRDAERTGGPRSGPDGRERADAEGHVPVWSDGGIMASAAVQTPWLLLALGSASFTWSDDAGDQEAACAIALDATGQAEDSSGAPPLSWRDGVRIPAFSPAGNVQGCESSLVAASPQQIALFMEPGASRYAGSQADAAPDEPGVASQAGLGEPARPTSSPERVGHQGPTMEAGDAPWTERPYPQDEVGAGLPPSPRELRWTGARPVDAEDRSQAGLREPTVATAAPGVGGSAGPTVGDALDTPAVTARAGHLSIEARQVKAEVRPPSPGDGPRAGSLSTETREATVGARAVDAGDGSQAVLARPTAPPGRGVAPGQTLVAGEGEARGRREGPGHSVDVVSGGGVPLPAPPMGRMIAVVPPVVVPGASAEHVVDQVVTAVRMQWRDGIGEAKLQLRPDAIGTVTVALRVEAGAVTAVVRAESAQVQEWILKNQESLRQQLEASGLHLDGLVVSPDDRGRRDHQPDPEQEPRRRQAARGTSTTGTRFEQLL
ncbi:MAG: flagellar hook-length control protein FliK [Acidobacteria bacterium]|nr:flagellar hook-length control protein FliK [Acidobacteriota bacterium]